MQLDYAILADGVTTRPDGKFDISGAGWDTIHADAVPATHPRLTLAVRLLISRPEAENPHSLTVIVQGSDGEEIRARSARGRRSPSRSERRSRSRGGPASASF